MLQFATFPAGFPQVKSMGKPEGRCQVVSVSCSCHRPPLPIWLHLCLIAAATYMFPTFGAPATHSYHSSHLPAGLQAFWDLHLSAIDFAPGFCCFNSWRSQTWIAGNNCHHLPPATRSRRAVTKTASFFKSLFPSHGGWRQHGTTLWFRHLFFFALSFYAHVCANSNVYVVRVTGLLFHYLRCVSHPPATGNGFWRFSS